MKLLWFYRYEASYNFDHFFHMDLVYAIRKEGHECLAYGPELHQMYNDIIVCEYDPNITMEELYEKFQFDVSIIVTQSRMYMYYRPAKVIPIQPERKEGGWLPKDIKNWNKPKTILEEDFHYEDNTNFYEEMNIGLVLQRHFSNVKRFNEIKKKDVKCIWHPFSVDETIFKPNDQTRENKLCLVGASVSHIYPLRQKVIETLEPLNLIEHKNRQIDDDYVKCLQSYTAHVCCSSIFDITPAKLFEIMASGSVLFANDNNNYGLKEIFDLNSYVSYEEEFSDIVKKVELILTNKHLREYIAEKGRNCIMKKHTHSVRIKQMIQLFEENL